MAVRFCPEYVEKINPDENQKTKVYFFKFIKNCKKMMGYYGGFTNIARSCGYKWIFLSYL